MDKLACIDKWVSKVFLRPGCSFLDKMAHCKVLGGWLCEILICPFINKRLQNTLLVTIIWLSPAELSWVKDARVNNCLKICFEDSSAFSCVQHSVWEWERKVHEAEPQGEKSPLGPPASCRSLPSPHTGDTLGKRLPTWQLDQTFLILYD